MHPLVQQKKKYKRNKTNSRATHRDREKKENNTILFLSIF